MYENSLLHATIVELAIVLAGDQFQQRNIVLHRINDLLITIAIYKS